MDRLAVYVRPLDSVRVDPLTLVKGEVVKPSFDWNNYLGFRSSATISSSSWAAEDSDIASVASATNSGGVTGCTLTAVEEGSTTIKNTAVLSNGETLIRKRYVRVIDPEANVGPNDYGL